MRIHPVAEIYPAMTDDEFQALVADIHRNGLHQPIIQHDGQIVDGRHRWRAIGDLKDRGVTIEPRFVQWDGRGDLLDLIHSLNFHRRHLSVTQKACVGVGYKQQLQETVKAGRPSTSPGNSGNISLISRGAQVRDVAAAKVGVSGKVVDLAEKIQTQAPDLFADMQAGERNVWDADRELKHRQKEAAQQSKVEAARSLPPTVTLYPADALDKLPELARAGFRAHLIAADPPYNQGKGDWDNIPDYPDFCRRWVCPAAECLAPGGSLYVFGTYQSLHPVYAAGLAAGLDFETEIVWDYINGAGGSWPRRHDMILYFTKPGGGPQFNRGAVQVERHEAHIREYRGHEYAVKTPGTVWRFPTVDAQSAERATHPTQKPVDALTRIVLASSGPGDTVLDPFAGSGTTLVAALLAGRRAVGIEISPDYCEIAHARTAGLAPRGTEAAPQ